jgi:CO dehydrogenase/acetyl-CoA synthase alpha subunit
MAINPKNLLKNVKLENVEISIGEVVEEDDFEPMGPVPKPPYIGLRPWDHFLFKRYKPTYVVENVDEHVKNLFRLTVAGTSNFIAIAKNRLKYAYQRLGRDAEIKLGLDIEAPLTRTLIGIRPKRLADLEVVMDYILNEFTECVASIHSSNEQNHLDFESKMFHLGMLTLLACEVAEIPYMMLTEEIPQTLEWGFGLVDAYKPVVLVVGDFPAVDLLVKFSRQVELVAGGCYALDMWKLSGGKIKICCVQSDLVDFIRSGVPDVIIVGENGAIPLDVAKEANCKVLSCSPRVCMGLPDLTSLDEEKIVEEVEKGFGAIVTDFEKISKVAVDLAVGISTRRKSKLELKLPSDVYNAKPPFGAFPEDVIRNVGVPVVMGTIPGVVAVVGCSEFDVKELGFVVENLAKRNYLILTTGCTALQLSKVGVYNHENVILMGSPTAIAHIAGLALKVGAIFARLPLRGNGLAVLDYLLNRVGAVGLAWSKPDESLVSIAWGVLRSGIPIVVGRNLAVAGRLFLGDRNKLYVIDNKTKEKVFAPTPEHLLCLANDEGEALILISKLTMRPNDGNKCRNIKVGHYIELHKRFKGTLPDDLKDFIRCEEEIPPMRKTEILEFLKARGWKETRSNIDPTVIPIILNG